MSEAGLEAPTSQHRGNSGEPGVERVRPDSGAGIVSLCGTPRNRVLARICHDRVAVEVTHWRGPLGQESGKSLRGPT